MKSPGGTFAKDSEEVTAKVFVKPSYPPFSSGCSEAPRVSQG